MIFPFAVFLLVACDRAEEANGDYQPLDRPEIILATTTSTQDSGLLDLLAPLFELESGYLVKVIAVGTGQALRMGEDGNADVLFVHAPAAEKVLIENRSAVDLVSRGDDSGTHKKELMMWETGGVTPGGDWYLQSGQGMGATLKISSEKQGYTLTDRATYLAQQDVLDLDIMVEGDSSLLNVYHAMVVNPEKWPKVNEVGARSWIDYLTRTDTQLIIGEFGVKEFGQPLFFPDAEKSDKDLGLE